jgi:phage baseplate assembly protein V
MIVGTGGDSRTGGIGDERTTDIDRRVANAVRVGTVAEVDYQKARARVKIGNLVTDWLPWTVPTQNGRLRTWAPIQVGQQVMLSAPSGDLRQAVISNSLASDAVPQIGDREDQFRIEFSDKTFCHYDMDKKTLTVSVVDEGTLLLKVGDSAIEMTKDGIKMRAKRIDLN